MDVSFFGPEASGRLVPTIGAARAFVPNDLPPKVNLASVINEFGEASAALGGLNIVGGAIANPHMVIRPLQRKEALRSSAMEGVFSTADDLALAGTLKGGGADAAAREVHNCIRAIDFAVGELERLPISHRVVTGMHRVLMEESSGSRGSRTKPGEYRDNQNWIGSSQIQDARFVPPPPPEAITSMDRLEAYINSDTSPIPPLIAAGLCHCQFETIHPFRDGNGRVGRMLITLQLLCTGLLTKPLLHVSPFVEANKEEYVDAMFAVSSAGDWERWLKFFLRAVKESCCGAKATIDRVKELQKRYRDRLRKQTRSVTALTIADHLFERPVISITDAATQCGVSYGSAKKAVDQLIRAGILQPVDGYENPKLFRAGEIIGLSQ